LSADRQPSVGLTHGIVLYVGSVVGTGILTLPAIVARMAGPASLIAWTGIVVLSIPLAFTFANLASRFPDSGGVSTFARRAFGPRWAAVTGWWFYFGVPLGLPVLGLFAGVYVAAAMGGDRTTAVAVSAGLVAVAAVTNWFGIRLSASVQLILVGCLTVLLVVAIAASIPNVDLANLEPFAPHGWLAIGAAASVLIWAVAGWEAVTYLAAEFTNPERDLVRATGVALAVFAVLYLGIAAASVLVLGSDLTRVDAPVAELLARSLGGGVSRLATAAAAATAILVTLGPMNAYMAAAAKLGSALGRDGAFPRWLAQGSEPGGVPRRSLIALNVLIAAVLALIVAANLETQVLVQMTTANLAAVYAVGCAAGVRLSSRGSIARIAAVVAFLSVLGLLVLSGPFLAWPTALGLGYVLVTHIIR
jgi:amino acid efflux transporter